MDSPFPTLALCFAYYYLVRVAGPRFMANREPFELRWALKAYNIFQIIFNSWLFYNIGMTGFFTGRYNYFCQPVNYAETAEGIHELSTGYYFFLSKFIDFIDTFFFVLRKKDGQITTLHLYHHCMMPVFMWPGIKYVSGGHSSFFAFLNSFVHIVMYTYYFLAAMGPSIQKYLWWKKYLTTLQMVQFVAASVHCFQLFFQKDCRFPKLFSVWIGFHEVCFLALFYHFYRRAYAVSSKKTMKNE